VKPALRLPLLVGLATLAVWSGWRIVAHTRADAALAQGDVETALSRLPGHPGALAALAERQAAAGDLAAAARTAHVLIQAAPLEGRAWRILAQEQAAAGHTDQARELYAKAIALSPRDLPSRAWMADDLLAQGRYTEALVHIDRLLDTSPQTRPALLGVLVQLSADEEFVDALVPVLVRTPGWRQAYLRQLQTASDPQTAASVMAALGAEGGLTQSEHAAWIDELIRRGQWGQAYAHWAGTLPAGTRLSPVFNEDFSHPLSGIGFDWRVRTIPGQTIAIEPALAGAQGPVAALEFRGRPAPEVGLEQALLLAPGNHDLEVRLRTENLRSDGGLEWIVACADGRVLGTTPRITGSSEWHTLSGAIQVPADCPGQWLRLRNPAPTERAQWTEGRMWVDRVRVAPANRPASVTQVADPAG